MESNRSLGAVLFGAGPDDAHPVAAGYTLPLGGGYMVGASNRYVIRWQNGEVYYFNGWGPDNLWFPGWVYLFNQTLKWFYDNTNP